MAHRTDGGRHTPDASNPHSPSSAGLDDELFGLRGGGMPDSDSFRGMEAALGRGGESPDRLHMSNTSTHRGVGRDMGGRGMFQDHAASPVRMKAFPDVALGPDHGPRVQYPPPTPPGLRPPEELDDGSGVIAYHRECERTGVLPSMAIAQQLPREEMVFQHYAIGEATGVAMAAAFVVNCTITTLTLSDCALGHRGVVALANALAKSKVTRVERCDLSCNGFSSRAAEAIADLLSKSKVLKVLSLRGNALHSGGVKAIMRSLTNENKTLTELDLSNTGAGDPAGAAIAEMLRRNFRLVKLGLAWNPIVNAWRLIADAVQDNSTIQVLDIASNALAKENGQAISLALAKNTSIRTLEVTDCRMSEEAFAEMAKTLQTNTCLEMLVMDMRGAKDLIKAFANNKSACKVALKPSNRKIPGEQEWSLEFDDEVSAEAVDSAHKTQQGAKGKGSLPSVGRGAAKAAPVKGKAEGNGGRGGGNGVVNGGGVAEIEKGGHERNFWDAECEEELKEFVLSLAKKAEDGDMTSTKGRGRANKRAGDLGKHAGGIDANGVSEKVLEDLGPKAWEVHAAYAAAQLAVSKDPKDVGALQAMAVATARLRKYHAAATQYLQAMAKQEDEMMKQGLQHALKHLLTHRDRYLPPKRRITLKIKNLVGDVELVKEHESPFLLDEEYEGMLRRIEDLLGKHSDPDGERVKMRLMLRDLNTELRELFNHYRALDEGIAGAHGRFLAQAAVEAAERAPKQKVKRVREEWHISAGKVEVEESASDEESDEETSPSLPAVVPPTATNSSTSAVTAAATGAGTPTTAADAQGKPSGGKRIPAAAVAPQFALPNPRHKERMPLRIFWRFARDCHLPCRAMPLADINKMAATCYMDEEDSSTGQTDPHNGNANGLFFIEFVETLIRCSWTLFPNLRSLSERFQHMMSVDVRAHAKNDSRDRLQNQLSAAIGSDAMDRHRQRLMKIFKHFSQEIGSLFAPSEASQVPGGPIPDTSPYVEGGANAGAAEGKRKQQQQEKRPFQGPYTMKPDEGASIMEEGGPASPTQGDVGKAKGKLSIQTGGGRGQPMVSPLGASGASEEGTVSMTFNDLLRMLNKLDLYSPQLNLTKVQSIVKQITMDKDLMPQEHPHNSKSKIIFEEFTEILARFAVACNDSGTPTALRLKEPQGAWTMLEEYLDSTLYPRVKKILPGRL